MSKIYSSSKVMDITFDDVDFSVLEIKTTNGFFFYLKHKRDNIYKDIFILEDKPNVQRRVKIILIKDSETKQINPRFEFFIWDKKKEKEDQLKEFSFPEEFLLKAKVTLDGVASKNLLKLISFLLQISDIKMKKFKTDNDIVNLIKSKELEHQASILENIIGNFSEEEINQILGRKKSLNEFKNMLNNRSLKEKSWQEFFEREKWIFGLGLDYKFCSLFDREMPVGSGYGNNQNKPFTDFFTYFH